MVETCSKCMSLHNPPIDCHPSIFLCCISVCWLLSSTFQAWEENARPALPFKLSVTGMVLFHPIHELCCVYEQTMAQ
jgi:hypothetical protein